MGIESVLAPLRAVVADPATTPLQREMAEQAIAFLQRTWNATDATCRAKMLPSLRMLRTSQVAAIIDLCFQCACAAVKAHAERQVSDAILGSVQPVRQN